jgi:hypothetical protein
VILKLSYDRLHGFGPRAGRLWWLDDAEADELVALRCQLGDAHPPLLLDELGHLPTPPKNVRDYSDHPRVEDSFAIRLSRKQERPPPEPSVVPLLKVQDCTDLFKLLWLDEDELPPVVHHPRDAPHLLQVLNLPESLV